ncbi:hypothetical protein D6779_00805 [Candidatus Parcubacteria bacterium]|nr:MAG: hypothetical protein D6779_00805 [Candidatus Parcubacteria bacterium]
MEIRKNPIILATAVVFGFWWLISLAYLWWQEGDIYLYMGPLYWGVQVFLFFFLLTLAIRSLVRLAIKRGIKGEKYRGAIITIGNLPYDEPIRSKFKLVEPSEIIPQKHEHIHSWLQNADTNSVEYRLFKRIVSLLYANRHVPASPVKGGHGGLSVFEHTLNVLNVGLEKITSWKVEGVSPKDPIYEQSVPNEYFWIAVLSFAAHDLGKINAYKIEKDGAVTITIRHHDKESARMLSDMPEYWELSKDDRFILNAVVAHGHSKENFPMRFGLEGRVILSFVVDIDHFVSGKESEAGGDIFASDEQIDEIKKSEAQELADFILNLLAEPGRVNSNDEDQRIAFKAGTRMFIHEQKLAKIVAEEFYDDPVLYEQTTGDGRRKITEKILYALDQRGLLVKEHKGKTFNYKAALFKAQAYNPKKDVFLPRNNKNIGGWPAVIVINLSFDETPLLISMSNAPFPPRIMSPVLAQKSTGKYSSEDSGEQEGSDPKPEESESSKESDNSPNAAAQGEATEDAGKIAGSVRKRRPGRAEDVSVLMEEIPESALEDVVIDAAVIKSGAKKTKKKKTIEQDSATKRTVKDAPAQEKSSSSQQETDETKTQTSDGAVSRSNSEEVHQTGKSDRVLRDDDSPAMKALKRRKKRTGATEAREFNPDDLSSLSLLVDDLPDAGSASEPAKPEESEEEMQTADVDSGGAPKEEEKPPTPVDTVNSQKANQQKEQKASTQPQSAMSPGEENKPLCRNCGKVTLKLLKALKSLSGGAGSGSGESVIDAEELLFIAKQAGYAQSYGNDEFEKYAEFVAHSIDEGRPAVRGMRYVRTEEGGIDYFVINA